MLFDQKHVEKWHNNAAERFKNFNAVLTKHGDLEVLDWRNKNGSGDYRVRFVFDPLVERMYISGDLGAAVFHFTEKANFENISRYSSLSYFFEKLETATDRVTYTTNRAEFELDLRHFADFVEIDDKDFSEEEFEYLVEDLWEAYEDDGIRIDDDLYERLNTWTNYRGDIYEWIGDVGRRISPRVILWLEALHMAREQLKGANS